MLILIVFGVLVIATVSFIVSKKPWKQEVAPKGHFMGQGIGIGIAIGMPIGLAIGLAVNNLPVGIAIGPGLGVSIGTAIGSGLEIKHRDRPYHFSEKEKNMRKWGILVGLVVLLLGLLTFTLLLFLKQYH